MKNKLILILTVILVACTLLLVGCNDGTQFDGVKVTYMLEGGTYQNGQDVVYQYFNFPAGTQNLIRPLEQFSEEGSLKKPGYDLVGWYRTKTGEGDEATYSDPWDFKKDKVSDEGVTLYAYWTVSVRYVYEVRDYDDGTVVNTQKVNAGWSFSNGYAARAGYTLVGLYDQDKNPWDKNFTHPGGDSDLAVVVYAKYVQGMFTVVSTASELSRSAGLGSNIYLANDIDMGGATLYFKNYRNTFLGNGHTVKNFVLTYSDKNVDLTADHDDEYAKSLAIAIFGNTANAKIKDVTFADFTVDVSTNNSSIFKVYVAPVAVIAKNTEISNVTVNGTVTVSKLPEDISSNQAERLVVVLTNAVCFQDEGTTVSNFTSGMIQKENNSEAQND